MIRVLTVLALVSFTGLVAADDVANDYFQIDSGGSYVKLKDKTAALKLLFTGGDKARVVKCDEQELSNKGTLRKK